MLISCDNDEPESEKDNPYETTEFTPSAELVSYFVDGISISSTASEVIIEFSTNKSWSLTAKDTWCKISPLMGNKGNVKAIISIDDNTDSDDRETIITLTIAEIEKYIKLTQNGNTTFNVAIQTAGTLKSYLGNNTSAIKNLTISGPLNGVDFNLITQMGLYGQLSILDLSNATIVEGGEYHTLNNHTVKTVDYEITDEMFFCYNNLTELYLPNNSTKIGQYAIYNCPKLKVLEIPHSVKSIDTMGLFYLPMLNDNLDIPEGVEYIGQSGLCLPNIKTLTLPSTIKALGYDAIACENLQLLHCKTTEPPLCDYTFTQFSSVIQNGAVLYVPIGCSDAYKNDKEWGRFNTIIEE